MAKIYDFKTKQVVYEHVVEGEIAEYFGMPYDCILKEVSAFYAIKKEKGLSKQLAEKALPLFKEFALVAMTQQLRDKAQEVVICLEKDLEKRKAE